MNKQFWRFFIGIPAAAVIYMPLVLLLLEFHRIPLVEFSWLRFGIAFILLWGGIMLVMWAYLKLTKEGNARFVLRLPTTKLVKDGPYQFIRNPIAVGTSAILLGEAVYFASWYLLIWTLIVIEVMAYHITHVEEYKLANKFGQEYVNYKMDVGRWFPKWNVFRQLFKKKK